MANFYLGCAIWSYKEWVGNFYPPRSRPADFLSLYGRRFTTVEGNTTFYAIPSPETIQKWIAQTPAGFKFCPKLNRQITHQGLLTPKIDAALSFLERMSGLQERLGTTFIQLPPSYSPQYLADLTEFLTACSQSGLSLALEVRHLEWFQPKGRDSLDRLLTQLNMARVLLDTRPIYSCDGDPQLGSQRRKPKVPLQAKVLGNLGFVRYISHPNCKQNQSYLEQWAITVNNWLSQGRIVYFMVHCPQEVRSPNIAKYFYDLIKQQHCNLPDLPWNEVDPQPTQLSLF